MEWLQERMNEGLLYSRSVLSKTVPALLQNANPPYHRPALSFDPSAVSSTLSNNQTAAIVLFNSLGLDRSELVEIPLKRSDNCCFCY